MLVGESWRPAGSDPSGLPLQLSYYNVVAELPLSGGFVVYNTRTESMARLEHDEIVWYKAIGTESGAGEAAKGFLKALEEAGFASAEPEVERSYLRYRYNAHQFNDSTLWIGLAPENVHGICAHNLEEMAVRFAQEQFEHQVFKTLYVSWQARNDENRARIESVISGLRGFCVRNGVVYCASEKTFHGVTSGISKDLEAVLDDPRLLTPRNAWFVHDECRRLLRPIGFFCSATINRAYVFDGNGNAYKCGNEVGRADKVAFSLDKPAGQRKTNWSLLARKMNDNPVDNDTCGTCPVLPLCQGGCQRKRMEGVRSCVPVKECIEQVVALFCESREMLEMEVSV